MFKSTSIKEAFNFCIHENDLYYFDKDKFVCGPQGRMFQTIEGGEAADIQILDDKLIFASATFKAELQVFDLKKNTHVYQNDPDTFQVIAGSGSGTFIVGDNLYVQLAHSDTERSPGFLNLNTGQLKEINFHASLSFQNYQYALQILEDSNYYPIGLAAINPETGSEVWRFTEKRHLGLDFMGDEVIEEIGEIFGVCNNRLWLSMAPERIVALNLQNGSTEREYFITHSGISSENKYIDAGQCLFHIGDVKYVPEEKKLIVFNYNVYGEFDLTSANPTWDLYDVKDTFTAHDMITVGNVTIRRNLICFNYTSSCKIAVFDRTQKKIVWSIDLKEIESNTTNARKIDMTDTHIYALDRNQHLFVFERAGI